jgi:hypothetical protein
VKLALGRWVRSGLFRSYLGAFVLLWLVMKGTMVAGAVLVGAPPFAFHVFGESVICAFELLALGAFLRRSNEDILLGNLGLPLGDGLLPFVPLHFALSLGVSVFG